MEGRELPCTTFQDLDPDSVLDGELDSGVVDYLSHILQIQCPFVSGLLPPSLLYALLKENQSRQKITASEFCVQIHVYPGHYLVSAQLNSSIFVIDSLYHPSHLPAVMPQLKLLYTDTALENLQYIVPQSQGATNLCGFFSVANAQYLVQNKSVPRNTNFDISEMRLHLRRCIIEGVVLPFPCGHSVNNNIASLPIGKPTTVQRNNKHQPEERDFTSNCFQNQKEKRESKTKLTQRQKYQLKLQKNKPHKQATRSKVCDSAETTSEIPVIEIKNDTEPNKQERKELNDKQKESLPKKNIEHKKQKRQSSEEEKEKTLKTDRDCKQQKITSLANEEKENLSDKEEGTHNFISDYFQDQKEKSERRTKLIERQKHQLKERKPRKQRKRSKVSDSAKTTPKIQVNKIRKHKDHKQQKRKIVSDKQKEILSQKNIDYKKQSLSEEEKQKKLQIDRDRKQQKRKSLTSEEKEEVRKLNRSYQSKKRKLLTTREQEKVRKQDRTQRSLKRQTLPADELEKVREQDRTQRSLKKQKLPADELEKVREQNRTYQSNKRNTLSASEQEKVREQDRAQHSRKRQTLPADELEKVREQNRTYQSKKRKTLTASEQEKVREQDRTQRSLKKQKLPADELEKVREQNRTYQSNKRKTLSASEQEKVREQDRTQHSRKRQTLPADELEKAREQNRTYQSKKRKTLTASEQEKVREQDRTQHSLKRQTLPADESEKVREQDRTQRSLKKQKLPADELEKVREQNRTYQSNKRKTLSASEQEKVREQDRTQHSRKRQTLPADELEKVREQNRTYHSKKRKTLTASEQEKVREQDRTQHSLKRQTLPADESEKVREQDRTQHSLKKRKLPAGELEKVRKLNRNCQSKKRKAFSSPEKENVSEKDKVRKSRERGAKSLDVKHEHRNKDTISHNIVRASMSEKEKETFREKDRFAKQQRRKANREKISQIPTSVIKNLPEDTIQDMLQNFFKSISDGPTYVCCCCNRFLYRSAVKRHSSGIAQNALKIPGLTLNSAQSEVSWICDTCSKSIDKQKIPSQSTSNNLAVEPVPHQLKNLSSLEKQLISKIIPFMKIVSLPTGSQHGLKGQVVLVPSNLQKTATSLPRQTGESQIIALTLKRRLSDKYGSTKQYIRPNNVNLAIQYLKLTNSHYSDTEINEDWTVESQKTDEQLWNSACVSESNSPHVENSDSSHSDTLQNTIEQATASEQDTSTEKAKCETDSEDEVDFDNPLEVVEDITLKRSLNSTTCLYPEFGPTVPGNKVLNLAPGEGQVPVSVFYQKHWETLAFPTLFPTGTGTFHEERPVSITPKKYVISKLLSKDPQFAESPEYTFQCLHWIESTTVADSISMSLKKSRQHPVTVRQLQNPERVQTLFKDEELFASFKKIRGTPQYWKEMQQNMLAKIRHYGTYTFFLSGSAADLHWPELIRIVAKQYGEYYSLDFIENHMDKKRRRNWLARNPVTTARHIDFIFRKLWGNVILSGLHPIGQILNYDIRKEMQSRGIAHFHSAVHVQDAPLVDKNTDDEVVAFVDQYITCSLPTSNETLRGLVLSRQVHHHTRTCKKKKGLNCRFHIPKPPSETTVVARHPGGELARAEITKARKILNAVMETLQQTGTDITLTELLNAANITPQVYKEAVKSSLKKTTIILKRTPSESCVNPYNPVLLTALRANMDIQYITDVWACVAYITSYMCKPERTMSDLMRNACKEANTVKDKLKKIGSTFLKSREVSQHERQLLKSPRKSHAQKTRPPQEQSTFPTTNPHSDGAHKP